MSDGKGYLTPDPPDPPDVICIKVFIPKHDLYIAAFWGAYQFFTNWNAWARDPLKRGKLAARVWKDAFEKARAHWRIFQGDCGDMINNLRAKPLEPCVLQALNDDGVWVDIFDASCCGGGGGDACLPQLRVSGGTIQQYNPSTGEWVPAGPETPPSSVPVAPPVYPPSNDGACLAATNFGALIEDRKNKFATVVGAGALFGTTVLEAFDLAISLFGIGWIFAILGSLVSEMYSAMQLQFAAVAAYDIEEQSICLALPHYANDGSMSQSQVDVLLAEISALQATFDNPSPERTAWGYVHSWVKSGGPAAMNMAANFMGITDGACEACLWEHTFDFREGSHGFVRGDYEVVTALNPGGTYIPGVGWKTQVIGDRPFCRIRLGIEPSTIVGYTVYYTGVLDGVGAGDFNYIDIPGLQITDMWINGTESIHKIYDVEPVHSAIDLRMDAYAGESHPDCSCTVYKLIVTGRGQNPFSASLPPAA